MKPLTFYKLTTFLLALLAMVQGIWILQHLRQPLPVKKARPAALVPSQGKIAIVIDDWGYNTNHLGLLQKMRLPVTVSVLPNLPYSEIVAAAARARGFEVIMHLPMEPYEKYRLEQKTIMTTMGPQMIADIIAADLTTVPHARGVNNHMGSRATSDLKTMQALFAELKKRRLYFLDSMVSHESRGSTLARQMNLSFARRDVFLDNSPDEAYILSQLQRLKERAQRKGYAIGIAHDRKVSLEVLSKALPELARDGYKLVFVSELVQ